MEFFKNCPKCGDVQYYKSEITFKRSSLKNTMCNKCSSIRQKKEYDKDIINKIIKYYEEGVSFSKIANLIKIKRDNVKKILIQKEIFIDGRDEIKKTFTENEINKIIELYQNGYSCEKIGKIYNMSKIPIRKLMKENKILRKGCSDGKKIILNDEQKNKIKDLYLIEFKNMEEISKILLLSSGFISSFIYKSEYSRTKSEGVISGNMKKHGYKNHEEYLNGLNEFQKYKREVISITNKQPINILENYNKRGNCGDDKFHLDHKFSIFEGFKQNIEPKIIGNINNLEFIPWGENLTKRTKCSINKEILLNNTQI